MKRFSFILILAVVAMIVGFAGNTANAQTYTVSAISEEVLPVTTGSYLVGGPISFSWEFVFTRTSTTGGSEIYFEISGGGVLNYYTASSYDPSVSYSFKGNSTATLMKNSMTIGFVYNSTGVDFTSLAGTADYGI